MVTGGVCGVGRVVPGEEGGRARQDDDLVKEVTAGGTGVTPVRRVTATRTRHRPQWSLGGELQR